MDTRSQPVLRAPQKLTLVGENLYRSDSSSIYYGLFKKNGKQIRRSLQTTDRTLAKRRLETLRDKIDNLKTADANRLVFAEFQTDKEGRKHLSGGLAKWWYDFHVGGLKPKSRLMYANSINMLAPYFRDISVRNIGLRQVQDWAGKRSTEVAARTFNADLTTLQKILEHAVEHGLLLENLAAGIKRHKIGKKALRIPDREEFRAMLDLMRSNAGKRDASEAADLVEFLGYSGCRISEVVGDLIDPQQPKAPMCWGDINFESGMATVKDTKNHESRVVPLFPPLLRLLTDMRQHLPEQPKDSTPLFGIKTATKALTTVARRLGLPYYSHHAFRHFFCSNAIEAGVDFKVIAAWLGHKDGGVLVAKTYGHMRDEHSALMAKRMTFDAAKSSDKPAPGVKSV